MVVSGVEVADAVTTIFERIKTKKDLHWVKFTIDDAGKLIGVKDQLCKVKDPPNFDLLKIDELFTDHKNDCFYLVVDVELPEDADGVKTQKLVFIQWIPDDARVKQRMLYASSAATIKEKFTALGAKIEANDISDVTYDAIKAAIKAGKGK